LPALASHALALNGGTIEPRKPNPHQRPS